MSKLRLNLQHFYKKRFNYLLILSGFIVVVLGGLIAKDYYEPVKSAFALAVSKHPEHFTELYFEDHLNLPQAAIPSEEQSFSFVINNREGKDFLYLYEVVVNEDNTEHVIDSKVVGIKNNESLTVIEKFMLLRPNNKSKIIVRLPEKQQQIHFWVTSKE